MIHRGFVEGVRSFVAFVALAGCSFSASLPAEDVGVDSGAATHGEEMPPTTNVAPCRTPDASGLVVCFEFEDSPADGQLDDSSPARRNAATMGVAQVPRDGSATSMAGDIGPQAVTYVAQDASLDLASAYTLAAWVRPDSAMPPSTARGLLDHEGQYAMLTSAMGDGTIRNRCQHAGVTMYEYTERLPVGQWQFLACTWDGTRLCAYRWASATDNERYCHVAAGMPAASGTRGLAVGHLSYNGAAHSRFDGALDSVQVYNRGMTEAQLCALIGQAPGCMPCIQCPP